MTVSFYFQKRFILIQAGHTNEKAKKSCITIALFISIKLHSKVMNDIIRMSLLNTVVQIKKMSRLFEVPYIIFLKLCVEIKYFILANLGDIACMNISVLLFHTYVSIYVDIHVYTCICIILICIHIHKYMYTYTFEM